MNFDNKVVVITGASSGIGAACAIEFAKSSAKLVLVGRNVKNLTEINKTCEEISGLKPLMIVADISVDKDVKRIVETTVDHYNRIDVLLNNAGICKMAPIQEGVTLFDEIMTTNTRSMYLLTAECIPYLEQSKGNVVNISSVLSTKPLEGMTAYCMSKAAMDMFTKCAALELSSNQVRVNSINPGPVRTEIFKRAGLTDDLNEELFQEFETLTPLRTVSEGEDVAKLALFLASQLARTVTGSCYAVDCGVGLGQNKSANPDRMML